MSKSRAETMAILIEEATVVAEAEYSSNPTLWKDVLTQINEIKKNTNGTRLLTLYDTVAIDYGPKLASCYDSPCYDKKFNALYELYNCFLILCADETH